MMFVIECSQPFCPNLLHYCHSHVVLNCFCYCTMQPGAVSYFLGIPLPVLLSQEVFCSFVLTSKGCSLSVVHAGIMMMTIPSSSTFSSREVLVWLLKLSIRTMAFPPIVIYCNNTGILSVCVCVPPEILEMALCLAMLPSLMQRASLGELHKLLFECIGVCDARF